MKSSELDHQNKFVPKLLHIFSWSGNVHLCRNNVKLIQKIFHNNLVQNIFSTTSTSCSKISLQHISSFYFRIPYITWHSVASGDITYWSSQLFYGILTIIPVTTLRSQKLVWSQLPLESIKQFHNTSSSSYNAQSDHSSIWNNSTFPKAQMYLHYLVKTLPDLYQYTNPD